MTRSSLLAILLLCVVNVLSADAAYASDEDLTSSAYLVFDPETGEFVTVQDANREKQNRDAMDPADPAFAPAKQEHDSGIASQLPLVGGGVLGVVVLAGLIYLVRKKRGTRPNRASVA